MNVPEVVEEAVKQTGPSITEDMLSLSLVEHEQKAVADIAKIEVQNRVLALEEECKYLLMARSERMGANNLKEPQALLTPPESRMEHPRRKPDRRRGIHHMGT